MKWLNQSHFHKVIIMIFEYQKYSKSQQTDVLLMEYVSEAFFRLVSYLIIFTYFLTIKTQDKFIYFRLFLFENFLTNKHH